jgi:hypothetical protein
MPDAFGLPLSQPNEDGWGDLPSLLEWDVLVNEHATMPINLMLLDTLVIQPLVEKNRELAQKVADLETKTVTAGVSSSISYEGVYQSHREYLPGQLVTRKGLWLCTAPTSFMPQAMPGAWKLICKERGVDAEPHQ